MSIPRLFCFSVLILATAAVAEEKEQTKQKAQPIPEPVSFVTRHREQFNGKSLNYEVRAGELYLKDAKGEPKASIFSFDYLAVDAGPNRPVTFVWNGGPGSSSVWLHMGTLGPKRISVPSDARRPGPAPYAILKAPETILDVTDLVFVDPVGTGFSRPLGAHEGKAFWGLKEDATSISEFIRDWITVNQRWNSPRFLLGESFGTTRAAKVAHMLEDEMNISLNGLVLVSQALDYQGSTPYVDHNLISFITYVPTMAAAALYHGKVSPAPESLEVFMDQARAFASDELLPALWKGNRLSPTEAAQIAERLSYFLGISPEYIQAANLRVDGRRFAKELLRDQGLAIGFNDARYTRDDMDDLRAEPEADASGDALGAAFTAALMSYMASDLDVKLDRPYLVSGTDELDNHWRWRPVPDGSAWEPTYVNTTPDLSDVLRINPSLKVLVASGYYDLITPFFDAEYTLNRHAIPADRVSYTYYQGGHMMYVHEPSRTQLLADIRQFIEDQTRGP
ncbi:MAG: serine carboxypeptidase [Pseudomonadota bacterium]